MSFKSGFVSIVGRPNVGKSTLLNQILKTKLAIMSDVAQTTRNTIQGIYTDNEAQIIFMDTPGIHKPQDGLGNFMNTTALNSIYGVDMVLFIAPANETIGRGDRFIIERLKEADGPVFLLLNKCDLVSKDEVIKKLTEWKELFDFKHRWFGDHPCCSLVRNASAYMRICLTIATRPFERVGLRCSFKPIFSMK